MTAKRAIARAFGAASGYDGAAHVQRTVAERLARRIADLALPERPRLLEIGCGTGFLTRALADLGVGGEWLVTDLSSDMVARCRERMGHGEAIRYLAMDGERPPFGNEARFDLICSSLAFQWFEDLPGAIQRLGALVATGGHLAFSTLAEGSFAEWRALYRGGAPDYPPLVAIAGMSGDGMTLEAEDFHLEQRFGSSLEFLRHLRAIGAHASRDGARPLPSGALRRAMRTFEADGAVAHYHIACCTFDKQA